ncbi:MAG: type II toxin-antitoxin system VapC family toxin [Pyrinomonadaceae bacterium]
MKLLLDTHAFIWSLSNPKKLPISASDAITNTENEVFVSSVSFWEISIKVRNNRLALIGHEPSTLVVAAESMGFIPVPITPIDAASQGTLLESTHFDPFDRMLIWQAISRKMTLVSGDTEFTRFKKDGLKLLWR